MKKHEVHIIKETIGFKSMKKSLSEKVELFLDKKAEEGYQIINVSFTYYRSLNLIAFITICK